MDYTYTEGKLSNGNTIKYKVTPSGTAYHVDTPDSLVATLERLRNNRTRIRVYYGDRETGRDWEEQYGVLGTIGRSTGSIKIPLMIATSRSMGGGALLDNCIVKVEYANRRQGGVIWQHVKYYRENTEHPASRSYYKPSTKPRRKGRARTSPSGFGGTR